MLLEDLINNFEELKKYIYLIDRGNNKTILLKFKNGNFFHLVGLHKTNIDMFIPHYISSKQEKYKYIKKNLKKFNNILISEINDNEILNYRIKKFYLIADLLKGENTQLFNLKPKISKSLYNGDYGLLKVYNNDLRCLLGMITDIEDDNIIKCAPQSWMVSTRDNHLTSCRMPIYMKSIRCIPIEKYDEKNNLIYI